MALFVSRNILKVFSSGCTSLLSSAVNIYDDDDENCVLKEDKDAN